MSLKKPTSFFEKISRRSGRGGVRVLWKWLSAFEVGTQRLPLVSLAVAAMVGIKFADERSGFALGGIAILMGSIAWSRRRAATLNRANRVYWGMLVSCLVFAGIHHMRVQQIDSFPLAEALNQQGSLPIRGKGWISDRVETREHGLSSTIRIESLILSGVEVPCDHQVPVWIQRRASESVELRYGSRIAFSGVLSPLESASVPGGFDPGKFYYRESDSLGRMEIQLGNELVVLSGRSGSWLMMLAQRCRDRLEVGLLTGVAVSELPYARLIAAMSLGAREESPEELEEAFRRSGTMHLFAVSGLHVGVVAGVLLFVLRLCRVPMRVAVFVIIPSIFFYAMITGLRPPALRSAIMVSVILGGFAIRERSNMLNSLALAALVVLAINSQQLFLPGFQLSFAVLAFLVVFVKPLQGWLSGPWMTDPLIPKTLHRPLQQAKDQLVSGAAAAFAVSLMSWLGSLGVLVWHFHSYAPIGIVANVFMIPVAGMIVGVAMGSLTAFSLGWLWLSSGLNQVNLALAFLLTSMAQWFGAMPGSLQNTSGFAESRSAAAETIQFSVMSRAGGGAILLEVPDERRSGGNGHRTWLIDSGGRRTYRQQVLPLLRTRGINRLDGLVLTHGDVGHIGEAGTVISHFRPSILIESTLANRSPFYPEIERLAERHGLHRSKVRASQRIRLGAETSLRVLSPSSLNPGRLADDRALVLKLEYGDMCVLLTSDTGFETAKWLLESGQDLAADIWIRGQHSESSQIPRAFIDVVSPQIVISSSETFPVAQVIPESFREQLGKKGIPLWELNETGLVSISLQKSHASIDSHQLSGKRILILSSKLTKL